MNITSENKIPKIIHYFWMGNTPPPLMIKCMESWKKQLPDWEFRLWNEKSFDFNSILWCKQALKYKKYAFVADFVRFYALYTIGGIYLDSDVELLKPLDPFLCYRSFISDNFQSGVGIQAEVFGATPGTPWLKDCLDYYMNTEFINRDGSLNMRPVDYLVEKVIKGKHPDYKWDEAIRDFGDVVIFPAEFFAPKNPYTRKINLTENTVALHHIAGTWFRKRLKFFIWIADHISPELSGFLYRNAKKVEIALKNMVHNA